MFTWFSMFFVVWHCCFTSEVHELNLYWLASDRYTVLWGCYIWRFLCLCIGIPTDSFALLWQNSLLLCLLWFLPFGWLAAGNLLFSRRWRYSSRFVVVSCSLLNWCIFLRVFICLILTGAPQKCIRTWPQSRGDRSLAFIAKKGGTKRNVLT